MDGYVLVSSGLNTPPLVINSHSNSYFQLQDKMSRGRSLSEPSLSVVHCSSYSRERVRRSDLAYEKGKDKLAHWIGAWGQDEVSGGIFPFNAHHIKTSALQVCEVLRALVSRCSLPQLEYLWTVSFFNNFMVHTLTYCTCLISTHTHTHTHRHWSLSHIGISFTVVRVAYSSLYPLLSAGRSLLDCGAPGNPRCVLFPIEPTCGQFHFLLPPQNKRLHRVQSAVVNREVFATINNYRVNYCWNPLYLYKYAGSWHQI